MTALILHGIQGHAGIHWQKWLNDQLIAQGHKVLMPNLPKAEHPDRSEWLQTVKGVITDYDLSDLVIVGHSLSVVTALDFIEQAPVSIKALVSVSGFSKDYKAELNSYFLKEKEIDFAKVKKNLKKAVVIYGDNDPYVPQEILKLLADKLNVKPTVIKSGGHLNTDAGFTTFPKLLKIINDLWQLLNPKGLARSS